MAHDEIEHERRIELLIGRLPTGFQPRVRWLRRPEARWARLIAAILLILGGCLWFLPILGLWMLPLGLLLLAEDIAPLRRMCGRILEWVERRRPHWLGLAYVRRR
jgi:hypothetical protein